MPTYEYICAKCHQQFELVQKITDKPLTVCPREKCGRKSWGKGKVKRMIVGGAGLLFKGSGFYITDYRSENYKAGAKKESGASTPAESKTAPAETKSGTAESKSGPAAPAPAGDKKSAAPATPAAPPKTESKPKTGSTEKS